MNQGLDTAKSEKDRNRLGDDITMVTKAYRNRPPRHWKPRHQPHHQPPAN